MKYLLSSSHTAPPPHIVTGGMCHDTQSHIQRAIEGDTNSIGLLADAGIAPHHPTSEYCPFGSEWTLGEDGEWHESPLGSEADRAAAVQARTINDLTVGAWPKGAKHRQIKAARAVIASANLAPEVRDAILTLTRT